MKKSFWAVGIISFAALFSGGCLETGFTFETFVKLSLTAEKGAVRPKAGKAEDHCIRGAGTYSCWTPTGISVTGSGDIPVVVHP